MTKLRVAIEKDLRISDKGVHAGQQMLIDDPDIDVFFLESSDEAFSPEELSDVKALIMMSRELNRDSLEQSNNLEWIGRFGAGFDNVDLEACIEKGILVSNSPQGVRQPVAEMVIAYIYALTTNLKEFDRHSRKHGFDNRQKYMTRCVKDNTLGIIGLGGISSRLAELVNNLGLEIIAYDPYVEKEEMSKLGIEKTNLEDLLARSDYVSIHVPLTKETQGMLGEKEFKQMKKSAYLINTARGGIYSDADLAKALEKGWIAGAGIDVYEDEPNIENNPLLDIENAFLTPHSAGAGVNIDAINMVGETLSECVFRMKKGKLPKNIINPSAINKEDIPSELLSPSYTP